MIDYKKCYIFLKQLFQMDVCHSYLTMSLTILTAAKKSLTLSLMLVLNFLKC